MKALSFRQPWAELVLQGRKTMDLRTYNTHYRGRLAIHASQTAEAEKCWENELNPDNLDAGGIVGTVELVDVIPLDEAAYQEHMEAHLAGRRWREGLYGWVLARPERLPELVPARGRTNLFNIDLDLAGSESLESRNPQSPVTAAPPPQAKRQPTYTTNLNGTTSEKPFALHVQALAGAATDYALTLRQRVVERPDSDPRLETVVALSGDNLRAVADHVIEALRKAEYKATDLSVTRQKPFYLPEEVGVRLGLVFLTVKPLTKIRRVEQISYGIRQMPSEEAYYWYSKCTAADTAERAQKALRVLLAAE
ncbi:MAG: ASCH domain-containing protein [Anaerolineae bacterium]|nr:ASCH domain-containing protein [Anaerolineae bacterium]